jgi:hypothetical protein
MSGETITERTINTSPIVTSEADETGRAEVLFMMKSLSLRILVAQDLAIALSHQSAKAAIAASAPVSFSVSCRMS